jgi:hypothetical protein
MTYKKDWVPRSHEARYDKAKLTLTYMLIPANFERMGLAGVKSWIEDTFQPAYDKFTAAYGDWENPAERTQVRTVTLNDAEEAFIVLYRQLYALLKGNPLVANADLVAMGMPERNSGGRHPAPMVTTSPVAHVKTPGPGQIEIHFRDGSPDGAGRAKPPGVHGAEIVWATLDSVPVDWSELVHSSFDTASPFHLAFEGHERGRHLYYALRWENTRGEKGPWSEIQSAVIP